MLKINVKSRFYHFLTALAFTLVSSIVLASSSPTSDTTSTASADTSTAETGFDAGSLIIHHVLDANEIHIADGLSIPLPIILYTAQGLDIFSFSNFWDEHHEPNDSYTSESTGNIYMYHHGHITQVDASGEELAHSGWSVNDHSFLDFSITKNVAGLFVVIAIMLFVFLSAAKAYKNRGISAPRGLQSVVEALVLFIRDEVAKPSIGKNYGRFMPILLTIFFLIWFSNLMGLIPFLGGMNITGNIAVTLVLACIVFVTTIFSAKKAFWMHIAMPPGVPVWLLPLMWPIEILGVLNKPLVLCLRLFANITAGHIIILSFTCLIFIFNSTSGAGVAYGVSVGSVLFSVFMLSLELLVSFLQAYVFTLLSAMYFGQAVEEHDHH